VQINSHKVPPPSLAFCEKFPDLKPVTHAGQLGVAHRPVSALLYFWCNAESPEVRWGYPPYLYQNVRDLVQTRRGLMVAVQPWDTYRLQPRMVE
jgi:hypothetical protein